MKTLGMVLLVSGLLLLFYGGMDHFRNRTVVQSGSMEIAAPQHDGVPLPAALGLIMLVGGVAVLGVGVRRGARS